MYELGKEQEPLPLWKIAAGAEKGRFTCGLAPGFPEPTGGRHEVWPVSLLM